jgi:hypothetical protein
MVAPLLRTGNGLVARLVWNRPFSAVEARGGRSNPRLCASRIPIPLGSMKPMFAGVDTSVRAIALPVERHNAKDTVVQRKKMLRLNSRDGECQLLPERPRPQRRIKFSVATGLSNVRPGSLSAGLQLLVPSMESGTITPCGTNAHSIQSQPCCSRFEERSGGNKSLVREPVAAGRCQRRPATQFAVTTSRCAVVDEWSTIRATTDQSCCIRRLRNRSA